MRVFKFLMRRATLITLLLAMLTGMALAAPGAMPHPVAIELLTTASMDRSFAIAWCGSISCTTARPELLRAIGTTLLRIANPTVFP